MPLEALHFDNRFAAELPGDPECENFRRQVSGACYSRVLPQPVSSPKLIAWSPETAALLDLPDSPPDARHYADVFAGNRVLAGMDPIATCYGGHQFGNWAGQLGDGRAINLGETVNRRGERWTLQLKGAGPTPYSRTADGLAVLRSSLREFLCSEAMFHLGVPTTRALSLVLTGEEVMRDMLYDGHPAAEPGAVVCRVAPSFTRFGHFEILAARRDTELLRRLLDFTIATDFPELPGGGAPAERYVRWFAEVTARTVTMIVHWMRVGFVHGVMNTDNMSVLGLTIDYGPYGWLEGYDPDWTPNTTDAATRRYRYGQQPAVAQWNLLQLANAILPAVGAAEPLTDVLADFARQYAEQSETMTAAKLGLTRCERERDEPLFAEAVCVVRHGRNGHDGVLPQPRRGRPRPPERRAAHGRLVRARRGHGRLAGALRGLARGLRRARSPRRQPHRRSRRPHERRQPALRAAQLPRPAGHRPGHRGRPFDDPRVDGRAAPPLRRATRQGGLRRKTARVGAQPRRLLDALLQFLTRCATSAPAAQPRPCPFRTLS